jgi:hypothetical protein
MPAPTFLGLDRTLYKSARSINLFRFQQKPNNINNEITMTVMAVELTRKKRPDFVLYSKSKTGRFEVPAQKWGWAIC